MTIAKKIHSGLSKSSLIRKMFEEGAQMKAKYGAENVYDFSIGNPNVAPPEAFYKTLEKVARESQPCDHSYMPQPGNPQVRASVAEYISKEQNITLTENEIFMSAGAAGALNGILKTILDPGDELLSPSPCFVEYGFYADNYSGVFRTVPTKEDFNLDIDAIEKAITEKTKAFIIDSPNNPTGQVYSRESLLELVRVLKEKGEEYDRTIYLISDEPYRKVIYDNITVPSILDIYPESIVVTSYSKDLSIPGERIGFAAISPNMTYKEDFIAGMAMSCRVLGHVNAPGIMQRVIGLLQGVSVDISEYQRKRNLLTEGLKDCGYDFITPKGAFYLFPKSPIPNDAEFVAALKEEQILTVPGSGFMGPGYFRISYCVEDATIINSLPGFKKIMAKYR